MSYQHTFDQTRAGDIEFSKAKYTLVLQGLELLRDEIRIWNERALQHGAANAPYEEDLALLENMISYEAENLSRADSRSVLINGMSIGSLRYIKAGLVLMLARREGQIAEKQREGWPSGVLAAMRSGMEELMKLSQGFDLPPADILEEINLGLGRASAATAPEWDIFISHASEDKDFVRPLSERLSSRGLRVWLDEVNLTVGDSLNRKIEAALSRSRFGVVVISPDFLLKEWPRKELDGLSAREHDGGKVILPVWHGVTFEDVQKSSPMLADRLAVNSARGIDHVVDELLRAVKIAGHQGTFTGRPVPEVKSEKSTAGGEIGSSKRAPHFAPAIISKADDYAHTRLKGGATPGEVVNTLVERYGLPRQMAKELTEERRRDLEK